MPPKKTPPKKNKKGSDSDEEDSTDVTYQLSGYQNGLNTQQFGTSRFGARFRQMPRSQAPSSRPQTRSSPIMQMIANAQSAQNGPQVPVPNPQPVPPQIPVAPPQPVPVVAQIPQGNPLFNRILVPVIPRIQVRIRPVIDLPQTPAEIPALHFMPTLNSMGRRLGPNFIPGRLNVLDNSAAGSFAGNVATHEGMSLVQNSFETLLKTLFDSLAVNREPPRADNPDPDD